MAQGPGTSETTKASRMRLRINGEQVKVREERKIYRLFLCSKALKDQK